MLCADIVIGTHDGPLEKAPDVLNAVGVDVTTSPFLDAVLDGLVDGILIVYSPVGGPFICIDSFGIGVLVDELMECLSVVGPDDLQLDLAFSLDGTDNHCLTFTVAFSYTRFLAAYPCLANDNYTSLLTTITLPY